MNLREFTNRALDESAAFMYGASAGALTVNSIAPLFDVYNTGYARAGFALSAALSTAAVIRMRYSKRTFAEGFALAALAAPLVVGHLKEARAQPPAPQGTSVVHVETAQPSQQPAYTLDNN